MATYKVLQPFQDGGVAYNPGDYAELDDNTAMIHAEHGNVELEPEPADADRTV